MERILIRHDSRAAANTRRVTQAKFTSKSREKDIASGIEESPFMVAQRKKLHSLFGGAAQLQETEEEPLQKKHEPGEEEFLPGKFGAAQRVEEEEPLQGKFETAQRVEEEEPLQGRFGVAQRVEEEEPLQGKFETAQRVEEEEPLQGKFGAAQRVEEEEPLQGKFEAAQRVEEEEPLQGKFEAAQRVEEEEPLQGRFEAVQRVEEEEPLQGKFTPDSSAQLQQEPAAKPNHTGLPDHLKSGIESLSGLSMDNVRVHYNSSQPAQLNALAYAQGTDIHVAPGQEQHLPHEAWHVVQQAQSRVQPTMQMKDGVPVNNDKGLEHEADVMGARAIQKAGGGNGRLGLVVTQLASSEFTNSKGENYTVWEPSDIIDDLMEPFKKWKSGQQDTSEQSAAESRNILASKYPLLVGRWTRRNDKTKQKSVITFSEDRSLSGGRGVKDLKAVTFEGGKRYSFVWHVKVVPV